MRIPGFTAEASLGLKQEIYALALGHAAENGMVAPQWSLTDFCSPGQCMHCNQFGCSCGPCLIRTHV